MDMGESCQRTLVTGRLGWWPLSAATIFAVTVLISCSRTEQKGASTPLAAASDMRPATCGNGRRDPDEACDYSVEYEDGCPDGWEICWECDQTCRGFRLHVLDEDWGACTQEVNGRLYSRREYDAWGHNVLVELDEDYDGEFDARAKTAFDAKGNQLFWERYGKSGRLEERVDIRHDAEGRVSSMLVDSDGDRVHDTRWTYHYDSGGNPTEQDRFVGKRLVESIRGRFDAAGRQVSWTRDANGDGSVDERKRYVYDPNGNMTVFESDLDGDGLFEDVRQYQYDMQGNAIVEERIEMPSGRGTERSRMGYDNRGNRTSWLIEVDGQIKERYRYFYDERGNLTLFEQDEDGDGTLDARDRRFYDSEGKLLRRHHISRLGTQRMTNNYACLAQTIPKAPQRKVKGE